MLNAKRVLIIYQKNLSHSRLIFVYLKNRKKGVGMA